MHFSSPLSLFSYYMHMQLFIIIICTQWIACVYAQILTSNTMMNDSLAVNSLQYSSGNSPSEST